MKAKFTKHGIKHDYRGAHVAYSIGGRTYLGTVTDCYRRELPSAIMFRVRHFNGEEAPDVAAAAVDILERDYEDVGVSANG